MLDVSVKIGDLTLPNPVQVASGTFGYGVEYKELVDLERLGAIVVKGIRLEKHSGNLGQRTVEVTSGMLNSIGLQGPGVDGFFEDYWPFLRNLEVPIIVNIWGSTVEEYAEVARRFDGVEGLGALELNVSCPNIKSGGSHFGTDLRLLSQVVSACRNATSLPLITKLSPNVSSISDFALAAEEAGSDGLAIMNSFPGMAIDVDSRRPKIGNITGGLSGPCIKPIALKLVWEAARVVRIPIIGMGGIQDTEDALEFLIAGASAVAVGTANFYDPQAAVRIADGIKDYMENRGIKGIKELSGSVIVEKN